MVIIGLLIMLGGLFYLMRSYHAGENIWLPIVVVVIGIAFFVGGKLFRRKARKKVKLGEEQVDPHISKIENETKEINKWIENSKK